LKLVNFNRASCDIAVDNGAGITLWADSIRKRPRSRSLPGADEVRPVGHRAARISAQRPRDLAVVHDGVARAQPGALAQDPADRRRRVGPAEPLALVDDRALPGIRRRDDDLAAAGAQAVEHGQQL